MSRALDKREYLVIIRDTFCQLCTKTYVVTSHLNRLNETVQMKGHSTLEPRYYTVRYNTNSDITRVRVGPQFSPNLPFFISLERKYVFQMC